MIDHDPWAGWLTVYIHINRHLSLSFSDEVPAAAEPGGAEAERLALFFESGWSDMALFLSRLKSSFANHRHRLGTHHLLNQVPIILF